MAKEKQITHVERSEKACNTNPSNKTVVIPFRVTVEQWKNLLQKAGGRGKLSSYIRKKLGLANDTTWSGKS